MPNKATQETLTDVMTRLRWDVGLNRHPTAELNGEDNYSCFATEFPGTVGYGATPEVARLEAETTLARQLQKAWEDSARRKSLSVRTVQVNIRVTEDCKRSWETGARQAGMSLGRFVEKCCENERANASAPGANSGTLNRALASLDERLKKLEGRETRPTSPTRVE